MDEWIALVAVISTGVVGLAGIIATFFAPARAQRKIEQRREARAFRRARRLVAHELDHGADMLGLAATVGKVPPMSALDRDFTTEVWRDQQGELGAALGDDTWDALRVAYVEFERAVWTMRGRATRDDPPEAAQLPDLPENHREMFPVTAERMLIAREMLLEARPLSD